ncbi:MAG: tail fiber protein [Fusobacteriaceae bacterium]
MAKLLTTIIKGSLTVSTDGTNALGLIYGDGSNITKIKWENIDGKTSVLAGAGLTGGGSLSTDVTLNVVSANDGITVGADSITLNVVNDLVSTSVTRALSANQGKVLQDGKVNKTTTISGTNGILIDGASSKNLSTNISISHPTSAANYTGSAGTVVSGLDFSNGHVSVVKTLDLDTRYYTEAEVDKKLDDLILGLDWKESVATYDDIATTYPTPDDGWTVNVKDTDTTYRYDGTKWVDILSAGTVPMASDTVDGKMSKEDFTKLRKIQTTGAANQWLRWDADGTAKWTTLPQSSTSLSGIVQLNNNLNSTSTTQAATANTAKLLQDQITALSGGGGGTSAFVRKIGDEMTGKLLFSSTVDLGVYHTGGTNAMIRRGAAANTTTVGNITGATLIESSANPRVKIGSTTSDIFHVGRKPALSTETTGTLPINRGGTGQTSFTAPIKLSQGFLRYDGTSFVTAEITLGDLTDPGGGTPGLDEAYLRLDGSVPMTAIVPAPKGINIGGIQLVKNATDGSLDFVF